MCGIVSFFGEKTQDQFKKEADKITYRGPDMVDYLDLGKAKIAFHRLAIMDLEETGMQPFFYDGMYAICNGEIYNFRILKKDLEFDFKSNSDCEIIIPLYKKFGTEMFKMIDAEFAMVIYDERTDEYIAARDPIGIRPMFYGTDEKGNVIAFSSEAKSLINLCTEVYPFPPGSYYKNGQFIKYNDITDIKLYNNHDLETIFKKINQKLTKAVEKRLDSDAPLGYLLSGGLDSSLICSIANKLSTKKLRTFSVGMATDAIDLKYAKEVADYLNTDHTEIIITKDDVLKAIDEVIYVLETYDITTIRASIGMYLMCKYIHEKTNIKVLLTGEISDELFGYKYTDFAPSPYEFQMESLKRVRELHIYDCLRADRCLASNSLEARVPFGDIDFVNYVLSITPDKKMNIYNKGKYLLRKAFEGDYLPESILYREKAAFSDAVGHSLVDYIKEYADNFYSNDEYDLLIKKYDFNKPFTKESLLYREIFEKHFKGKAKLIKDFWMPNKNWENCDVNDPSARILKNYGDSGK